MTAEMENVEFRSVAKIRKDYNDNQCGTLREVRKLYFPFSSLLLLIGWISFFVCPVKVAEYI